MREANQGNQRACHDSGAPEALRAIWRRQRGCYGRSSAARDDGGRVGDIGLFIRIMQRIDQSRSQRVARGVGFLADTQQPARKLAAELRGGGPALAPLTFEAARDDLRVRLRW